MADGLFVGSDFKQGDFQPLGQLQQSDAILGLSACLYKQIDGDTPIDKGITVWGLCSIL